ncbi:MAG: hypothetical protein ABI809_13055 [Caldimonas sp.]
MKLVFARLAASATACVASCAVSRRGRVALAAVNEAIGAMRRSGELEAMYARYR